MAIGSGTALGWGAQLSFGEETVWGTKIIATNFMEFFSESLGKTVDDEKIEALGGNRAFVRRVQKQISVDGTIAYSLHPIQSTQLLKHTLMGTVTSAVIGATVAYNHTFTTGDLSGVAQKGLSFDVKHNSNTTTAFFYTGCRVDSLKISGAVNDVIKAEVSLKGKDAVTGAFATTTALYSAIRPFLFQDVTFSFDGSIASLTAGSVERITSFDLTINNNLQGDDKARSLGDATRTALPPGRREIKLSMVQRFDTTTAFTRFTQGVEGAIRLAFDTGITIGAALTTYSMFIDLPRVYYSSVKSEISDAGILTHNIDVSVIADTTTSVGKDIVISLTNSNTSYA